MRAYVRIYVCVYTHTLLSDMCQVHAQVFLHMNICIVYTYVRVYMYIRVHIRTYICMCVYTHAAVWHVPCPSSGVSSYEYMYCTCVYTYVGMCVHMYMRTRTLCCLTCSMCILGRSFICIYVLYICTYVCAYVRIHTCDHTHILLTNMGHI